MSYLIILNFCTQKHFLYVLLKCDMMNVEYVRQMYMARAPCFYERQGTGSCWLFLILFGQPIFELSWSQG